MRHVVFIGILSFFASAAFAQAADVDAIDLSAKMDTIARGTGGSNWELELTGFLNVGYQNIDSWQDFELGESTSSPQSLMRFGGSLIFDTTINPAINDYSTLYEDFDGDGIGDIIAHGGILFFKGLSSYPYFNPGSTSELAAKYKFTDFLFPYGIDFNADGFTDLITETHTFGIYISLFKGGKGFGKNKYTYADDSIPTPIQTSGIAMTTAKFGTNLKPMIVWSNGTKTFIIKQTGNNFSQDSVILVSDSANGGIRVTNLYATDITGDGIIDLIVSDGLHIYIFKGGDNFGTYPLTSQTAFYTIKSPRLSDYANYGFIQDFGTHSLRACGDLTGSGIPYLAVGADINEGGGYRGYQFFYAGGKALDTLFDAVVSYTDQGLGDIDTLHSINATGRTVCLLNDYRNQDFNNYDLDFLMSRDCDKIPHKTNPQMLGSIHQNFHSDSLHLSCFPSVANKFTKVQIVSDNFSVASLTIFNLLGEAIEKRTIHLDSGNNTEFFNTSEWVSGTYIIKLEAPFHLSVIKVIVEH